MLIHPHVVLVREKEENNLIRKFRDLEPITLRKSNRRRALPYILSQNKKNLSRKRPKLRLKARFQDQEPTV